MAYCLVIDTHTNPLRVLLVEGDAVAGQRSIPVGRGLTARLLEAVDALVKEPGSGLASLKRVAVHRGPGPPAAVRTGAVVGMILALGVAAELVGIDARREDVVFQALSSPPVSVVKPYYDAS